MVEHEDLSTSEKYRNQPIRFGLVSGLVCFVTFLLITAFFAPLGFSPTDDGYILSMSSKIIHGEIPHKDFISIRPVGSSIIALYSFFPFLDEYQLLISRVVCSLELMVIVWLWLQIISRFYVLPSNILFIVVTTIVATTLTFHDFPLMAWHTIDGVFFCSLAFFLRTKSEQNSSNISILLTYLFLGLGILCKQSFVPMMIASFIVFQDYKKVIPYVGILFFPLIYFGWITLYGGFWDVVSQLTSQSSLLGVGFKRYLIDFWFIGGIVSGGLLWFLQKRISKDSLLIVSKLMFLSIVTILLLDFILGENLSKSSVLLFGVLFVVSLKAIIQKKHPSIVLILVTILAWSSALSIGYSFPSLLSGAILVTLFLELFGIDESEKFVQWKYSIVFSLVGMMFIVGFVYARTTKIYREAPANQLTYPLSEVLQNGRGIFTNESTFSFLNDANSIRNKFTNSSVIFAPDMAGLYSDIHHPHPTISTWSRELELPNDALKQRFQRDLKMHTSKGSVFAISKYKVEQLATELTLLNQKSSDSPVVRFAKNKLRLVDSTSFFYIYSK